MKVEVLIEKDETGYFVADVPALPGCVSQGKTLAEAKENIKEAINLWVEVMMKKHISQWLLQIKRNIFAKE